MQQTQKKTSDDQMKPCQKRLKMAHFFKSPISFSVAILLTSQHFGNFVLVFHLPKNSANSIWDVNGTRRFGSFCGKFSGRNRIFEKVVPFHFQVPRFHLQICRLSHQFQAFRGIFRAQLQLKWRISLIITPST